ncbi:hypothetical protein AMK16_19235 [Streptomyces sp. CB00455]|uniref:hypothetical protein n=1 Tax=Streptomyces sp. CB00455 TaxID=1703927 RepID=UPI00093AAD0C|nr:hypothetical protein [Streptomyces sp. CB00455]OKK18432.1 hypothetical protein AMK16_19235 [Streptomyces sp. CB00455]
MTYVVLFALIATGAWITSTVTLRTKALERRAERLERRMGLLLDHLGIEEPEQAGLEDVRALLRAGRTIEAIKVYRRLTGADLREAKTAVEALEAGVDRTA